MKATWSFPVWGNILSGQSNMACAYVHDDYIDEYGKVLQKAVHAVEINGSEIIYHPVAATKRAWDITKKGINTTHFTEESLRKIDKIRKDCLLLFEQSFGWKFRVKGTDTIDTIIGVDHASQMVKGKEHKEFHIDECQLTSSSEKMRYQP
jgi:hypothetical protein